MELLTQENRQTRLFVATDLSIEMLNYSRDSAPVRLVCDAQALPFAKGSFDLVVSSLADPYNTKLFWEEAAGVLRRGGHVLFTAPAIEWACQFRMGAQTAEFMRSDGLLIEVASHVHTDDDQRRLMEASGLQVVRKVTASDQDIRRTARSPKLRSGPVVVGYLAQKN
jgi:SAM-dependent methyltransferase